MISSQIFHTRVKSAYYSAYKSALCTVFNDGFSNVVTYLCTTSKDDKNKKIKLPEEPQNCCMSGCANCVWVAYAEELAKILNDGGETAKQKIMEHVKDPNLRAFLMLELNDLFKKKK